MSRPSPPLVLALLGLLGLAGCEPPRRTVDLPPVTSATDSPPWQLPSPTDPGQGESPRPVDPTPIDRAPLDPSSVDPRPVAPSPVAPSPVAPSPVAPSPVAPSPAGRAPSRTTPPPAAVPDDEDDAPRPDLPTARNPLIQGLSQLAGSVPLEDEQTDELIEGLSRADELLSEIKDENQRAIAELNRQVQLKAERHPNVIIVLAHGLGARSLSCCGGELPTPAIDQVAAQGAIVETFYSGADPAASLWSLLSGWDTSRASAAYALPSRNLLSEMMWRAGYQTAFVGHWPLPMEGRLRGFDEWLGAAAGADPHFPATVLSRESRVRVVGNAEGKREQFADELYMQEALSVLSRRDRRRPFLMVISLTSPGAASHLGVDDIAAKMVQRLDRDVARLDAQLEALRLRNSTALMITSSVPPAAGQAPWKGAAGELYEGALRVPLIVRWPERIDAGREIEAPFAVWDLMPTCASLAAAFRAPRDMHGADMSRFLFGTRSQPLDRMLYWQLRGEEGFAQAVRQGPWKVVRPAGKTRREDVELYNLHRDPRETENVADRHPDVLEQFLKDS